MSGINTIFKKIKRIMKNCSGESIAETLVSALIAVMAMMVLAGAILSAARVNSSVEHHTLYLNEADSSAIEELTGASVSIDGTQTMSGTINAGKTVKKYHLSTGSGYLYYYE
ncbi:MAG: hypothetical protein K6F37_09240 [Lachnospiraceae bacterium]|nr:hypothetical protein [Lachnospiraceae bacterium]